MRVLIYLFCFILLSASQSNAHSPLPSLLQANELIKYDVTILEVSAHRKEVNAHIPGAMETDFYNDGWVVDYENLPNMLPHPNEFSKVLSSFGLTKEEHIVLVATHDDWYTHAATARIFWSLRIYGYEHLSILDGGLQGYIKQGFTTTLNSKRPKPVEIKAEQTHTRWLADYNQVYAGSSYNTPVMDARDFGRARGEEARHPMALRSGKIFEAEIIPSNLHFKEGGWFYKDAATIRDLYDDVWGKPAGPIVFYSDTGLRAAISWFAAHEIAKEKDVRLYDGSYLEWDHLGHEVFDETDDMGGPIG